MDPNATLAKLRRLASTLQNADGLGGEIAETFDILDTWLSHGGFLPAAWDASRIGTQYQR